ncbi:MAG: hypothetical protein GY844_15505 [Bradyrhizobium sp.]|nr:hypothetical protein [Bradyrhizobium sp.]
MKATSSTSWVVGVVALSILSGASAFAQSANPALERCRETVGRPIVAACMQQGEGSVEKCRAKATPAVRRCMAANGGGAVRQKQESPTPDTGKGTLAILMPGAGGATASDFLVRNKERIGGSDVSVIVTTSSGQAASLSQTASDKGRKVILVGMSRGSIDVANALADGAKANAVVLVSGAYSKVRSSLGSPSRLPATLVIHHRKDECHATPASAVAPFVAWSGGRASTQWIDNQGTPAPNPCGPRGAHGFFMQDGAAVSAINGFIKSR